MIRTHNIPTTSNAVLSIQTLLKPAAAGTAVTSTYTATQNINLVPVVSGHHSAVLLVNVSATETGRTRLLLGKGMEARPQTCTELQQAKH
jgi:hypothetical protein